MHLRQKRFIAFGDFSYVASFFSEAFGHFVSFCWEGTGLFAVGWLDLGGQFVSCSIVLR